jgi:general secretion pathway protein N
LRRSIILALVGFVLVLILRFPARWAAPLLPHAVHCDQLEGSVWSGRCSALTISGSAVGDLDWDLHFLPLLRGQLDLQLDLANQGSYLRGNIARGFGGELTGRDVSLDVPLNNRLVSSIPAGVQAHLSGRLARVTWNGTAITALQGEMDVQDLIGQQGLALGNYHVTFVPAEPPSGELHDTGGPLQISGSVKLLRDGGYDVDGLVAARPSAPPTIVDAIKYLDTPDAQGRRRFSIHNDR